VKRRNPWIKTLALVAIAAALAGYIFLVEVKREPLPEKEVAPTPAPLWEFEGGDIVKVAVTRGQQVVAVERGDEVWRMTVPEEIEIDSARMDDLARRIANVKTTRALADVDDLAAFGLQKPETRVMLALSDETKLNLKIGVENPGHTARYVQKEGDPLVYLVPKADAAGLLELAVQPPYPRPTETPTP